MNIEEFLRILQWNLYYIPLILAMLYFYIKSTKSTHFNKQQSGRLLLGLVIFVVACFLNSAFWPEFDKYIANGIKSQGYSENSTYAVALFKDAQFIYDLFWGVLLTVGLFIFLSVFFGNKLKLQSSID